jgi:hypothetical protein
METHVGRISEVASCITTKMEMHDYERVSDYKLKKIRKQRDA